MTFEVEADIVTIIFVVISGPSISLAYIVTTPPIRPFSSFFSLSKQKVMGCGHVGMVDGSGNPEVVLRVSLPSINQSMTQ